MGGSKVTSSLAAVMTAASPQAITAWPGRNAQANRWRHKSRPQLKQASITAIHADGKIKRHLPHRTTPRSRSASPPPKSLRILESGFDAID